MKMLDHWLPPEGAGAPVACIATSFTFDTTFFSVDPLARFLSLSTRDAEGTEGPDVAGMLEEEEKLADVNVSVLVDQSCQPDIRNLRWDLLPVRVPGGLLHAKVAVLLWEKSCRVLIGSANLTEAGYRSQVEIAMSFDVVDGCVVPREVFEELADELRSLLSLVPGLTSSDGPMARAVETVELFEERIASVEFGKVSGRDLKIAFAPSGTALDGNGSRNPIDRLPTVWQWNTPTSVTALSPFWDDVDDMPGARAILEPLPKRVSEYTDRAATFVVPVDSLSVDRIVRAPRRLLALDDGKISSSVVAFKSDDDRRLHAKCLRYESEDWMAVMFGSSNITAKGLGLDARPHREINLWVGVPLSSKEGKALKELIPIGDRVREDLNWDPLEDDEAEEVLYLLPAGFESALLIAPQRIEFRFDIEHLPEWWSIAAMKPGETNRHVLLDSETWNRKGRDESIVVEVPFGGTWIPSFLQVQWRKAGEERESALFLNVADRSILPPPEELKALSLEDLLAVLASTRPLRDTMDSLQRAKLKKTGVLDDPLDPLKTFDSSGMLLQRTRRRSASLAGVQRRLDQPVRSMDILDWRLSGVLGPENLAQRLVESDSEEKMLPGEAAFFLAELALVIGRIDWSARCPSSFASEAKERVRKSISLIEACAMQTVDEAVDRSILDYVENAFRMSLS
jgi:hypothetical protein